MVIAPYMVCAQYYRFSDRHLCLLRCPAQIPDGLLRQIKKLMFPAGDKGIFLTVQRQRHVHFG